MATPAQYATTRPITHGTTTAAPTANPVTWTLTKTMLVFAVGANLLAALVHTQFFKAMDPMPFIVLAPGLVFTALLFKFDRPWVYLTAGILSALLPLLVLGVFGAATDLLDTSQGYNWGSLTLLLASLLLALPGGIVGFIRARKRNDVAFGRAWGTGLGTYALVVAFVSLGTGFAGALVGINQTADGAPGGYDFDVVDIGGESMSLEISDFQFSERTLTVTLDKVTEITVSNEDGELHTFTYEKDGVEYNHDLLGGSSASFLVLFEDAGTILFRCVPHSGGYSDDVTGDEMTGVINVVA